MELVFNQRKQRNGKVFEGRIVSFLVLKYSGGDGEYGPRGCEPCSGQDIVDEETMDRPLPSSKGCM
jgi:hypothetical protein